MHLGAWGLAAPGVRAAIELATRLRGHGSSMHLACSGSYTCLRAVRQGEPMQAPKSPAAMKGADRGGRDSSRAVGIQAVRESDETL